MGNYSCRCGNAFHVPDWVDPPIRCPNCGSEQSLAGSSGSTSGSGGGVGLGNETNNGFGVTGFVLGLVSIFVYFIGIIPLLAMIFSAIGLSTFKEQTQKNKWMAITGLILGILFSILCIAFWANGGRF